MNVNVGSFVVMGVKRLPYKVAGKIEKGKGWEDRFPGIPFILAGRVLSTDERSFLFEKEKARAERAAKKAAKVAAGWVEKPRKAKEGKIVVPRVYPQPAKVDPKETKRLFAEENARLVEANSFRLQAIQGATDTTTHLVKRGGKWVQVGADNLTAHIENR
jgi:hypothetical protein